MGRFRRWRFAATTVVAEGAARSSACAVMGRGAQGIAAGRCARSSGANQVVAGMHGLSAATCFRLVRLHKDVRTGIEAGSRLRGEPVLGGDAVAAVLLLNGP